MIEVDWERRHVVNCLINAFSHGRVDRVLSCKGWLVCTSVPPPVSMVYSERAVACVRHGRHGLDTVPCM